MVGSLARERYISLTTFRADGTEVSTPVWVVSDDGRRLLVWTGASTWKVKRIRRNPRVLVAASTFSGKEKRERIEATARVLEGGADIVVPLLRKKYPIQRCALELQAKLARRPSSAVYLEIS
ncbi:MAG TPA: PPOX class F420-dependent oxidoreductase [Gaiellaceae bacterium]|nr:PPOX class F420-dependent oxidoreductase [Gaiellaceae bacterium]